MRGLVVAVGALVTGALAYWLTGVEGQPQEYQVAAGAVATLLAAAMLSVVLLTGGRR